MALAGARNWLQYTETLVNALPFQGEKKTCQPHQTEDEEPCFGGPQRGVVPQERTEGQDGDPGGREEGRTQDRYVPEIVGRQ